MLRAQNDAAMLRPIAKLSRPPDDICAGEDGEQQAPDARGHARQLVARRRK